MGEILIGIDEAGVGTLAGPLVAAVVVLPKMLVLPGVKDSKKLTDSSREELVDLIYTKALYYSVETADSKWIDKEGIWNVWNRLVVRLVLDARREFPRRGVLIDGNRLLPGIEGIEPVVGGDALYQCISAASILAKYVQTCTMDDIHSEFPRYGFSEHRGYGTPQHLETLRKFGPCQHHRMSYKPVQESCSQHAGLRPG